MAGNDRGTSGIAGLMRIAYAAGLVLVVLGSGVMGCRPPAQPGPTGELAPAAEGRSRLPPGHPPIAPEDMEEWLPPGHPPLDEDDDDLPPGHPPVGPQLPPGHPTVQPQLPPGHPKVPGLSPGHPPVDGQPPAPEPLRI